MKISAGAFLLTVALFLTPLSEISSGQGTQGEAAKPAQVREAAFEIMASARYATLVTIGETGQPQARIVDPFAPEENLAIWIATNPRTRKVDQIRRDNRVTLLYFNPGGLEFVTVIGTAELVADEAEKAAHWKEEWRAFYKDGNQGPDYLLIKVRPTRLELVSPKRGLTNDPVNWRPVAIELP